MLISPILFCGPKRPYVPKLEKLDFCTIAECTYSRFQMEKAYLDFVEYILG